MVDIDGTLHLQSDRFARQEIKIIVGKLNFIVAETYVNVTSQYRRAQPQSRGAGAAAPLRLNRRGWKGQVAGAIKQKDVAGEGFAVLLQLEYGERMLRVAASEQFLR